MMAANKPILYNHYISPAGRAVQLIAHCLNVELVVKEISVLDGEQLTPAYLKVTS